jgi:ADP-ribosylarginine hydrolase
MTQILEKYIAAMVLHSLGDTIGFKNGEWEFNYFKDIEVNEDAALEILYEFIYLGGINGINLKDWYASDDTYYHHAIAKSLIISDCSKKDFYKIVKECMVDMTEKMEQKLYETNINKQAGIITIDYVIMFKQDINGKDGRTMPYNKMAGGSGCAMRTICIGMAYFGEENRNKLIEVALETSRLTHNSPIGYLGGLVVALFSAYAIEGIDINQWPFLMMDILKSEKITSYLKIQEEKNDYEIFMKFWRRYLDIRFKNNIAIKSKVNTNLLYRTYYYNSKLVRDDDDDFKFEVAGSSGFSAGIVAYDCLIDAGDKWEKLVIYSMLHIGDSDTTGCIAAGLYGLLYGFGDVPKNNMKYLELKKQSEKFGELLFKKYYLRENIEKYIE